MDVFEGGLVVTVDGIDKDNNGLSEKKKFLYRFCFCLLRAQWKEKNDRKEILPLLLPHVRRIQHQLMLPQARVSDSIMAIRAPLTSPALGF